MSALDGVGALREMPIRLVAELGRRQMTVSQILEIVPGSVVRMNRSADENVDVLAGGVVLATGEIVAVENTVAIRITDFASEE